MRRKWRRKLAALALAGMAAISIGYISHDVTKTQEIIHNQEKISKVDDTQNVKINKIENELIRLKTIVDIDHPEKKGDPPKPRGLGCVCIKDLPERNQREVTFCVASAVNSSCSAENQKLCEQRLPNHRCH